MMRRLVLVGWRDAPAPTGRWSVERMPSARLSTESLAGADLVVLGADVVATRDPVATKSDLGCKLLSTIVCVGACDGATLALFARWIEVGYRHVEPSRLAEFAAACRPAVARPHVSPQSWLARIPAPGSVAERAVEALPRLTRLGVGQWADAVGISTRALLDLSRREFGVPSKTVIANYRVAVALELRRQDKALEECSASVDLSEYRNLLRLCGRRGVVMPPRRPPRNVDCRASELTT